MSDLRLLIFDWGGTIMKDTNLPGPMYLWERVAWVEGAREALEHLFPRFPLVIATNAPHSGTSEMILALDRVDATRFFSRFYSSRELEYGKPDPRFFLEIARREQLDPASCLMIGNHYRNDIEGAALAGMSTIYYNEKLTPPPFEKACQVIWSMRDLPAAIDRILHEA